MISKTSNRDRELSFGQNLAQECKIPRQGTSERGGEKGPLESKLLVRLFCRVLELLMQLRSLF